MGGQKSYGQVRQSVCRCYQAYGRQLASHYGECQSFLDQGFSRWAHTDAGSQQQLPNKQGFLQSVAPCSIACDGNAVKPVGVSQAESAAASSALASHPHSLTPSAAGQRNARGEPVKVEARWEGTVHKTVMTGGRLGPHQCWRYMEGGLMAVRSSILCPRGECVMHWYLELITEPERLLYNPDGGLPSCQGRVASATLQSSGACAALGQLADGTARGCTMLQGCLR